MIAGPRAPDGGVLVYGLPADVVAVAFTSGAERFWARPDHGAVLFPFDDTASPEAKAEAYAANDTIVQTYNASNDQLTNAEVVARAVTTETAESLASGWFVDIDGSVARGFDGRIRPLPRAHSEDRLQRAVHHGWPSDVRDLHGKRYRSVDRDRADGST